LNHFAGGKRALSSDKLLLHDEATEENQPRFQPSSSMPAFPSHGLVDEIFSVDIPKGDDNAEANSSGRSKPDAVDDEDMAGLIV
jgi:hypothetical protein